MKKFLCRLMPAVACLLVLALGLGLCGWVLMPVRRDYGACWEEYLQEEENTVDVLFIGSSMVYCDVVPSVIWEETGAAAYVVAGPELTMSLSYYYLQEACRTQTPHTVFVEMTGMFFGKYQDFTKVNVGYMPWSVNRIAATFNASEPAERLGLLFPLWEYHYRWQSVTPKEVYDHLFPEISPTAGYTVLKSTAGEPGEYERNFSAETENYAFNLQYLQKIADYCRERNIQVIPYVAPSCGKIPSDALETLRHDCDGMGLTLVDCNEYLPGMDIDNDRDWYDTLHFNTAGADKFSRWMSRFFADVFTPTEGEPEAVWQNRADIWTKTSAGAITFRE